MENTFLHFNNEDTFQNQKSEIKNASVSFIKDSGKLYTHGEEYDSVNWGEIKKLENGVYVYTNTGQLIKPEAWDTANNDNAVGVAVITDNCRFVISKNLPMTNNIAWSDALHGTDVSGILTSSSSSTAQTDYAGQNNTNLIRSAASGENSSNNAAHYCYAQTLNGQHGYLPALGELVVMYNNKSDIDEALVLIGSQSISDRCDELQTSSQPWFWSSTELSSDRAWFLYWEYSSLYLNNSSKRSTYSLGYAFPVFPLNL